MNNRTPKSTATRNPANIGRSAARLEDAARRIGASGICTPHELCAADTDTRSLAAAASHPFVSDISDERGFGDGVWIYLKDGVTCLNTDTGSIHEDTVAEALACLKRARYIPENTDEAQLAASKARKAAAATAAPAAEARPVITAVEAAVRTAAEAAEAVKAASLAVDTAARKYGFNGPEHPAALDAYAAALAAHRTAQAAAEAAAEAAATEAAAPAPSGVDYQMLVNADWNARCEVQAAARRVEAACREQGMGSPGHRFALMEQERAFKRAADIAARLAAARLARNA